VLTRKKIKPRLWIFDCSGNRSRCDVLFYAPSARKRGWLNLCDRKSGGNSQQNGSLHHRLSSDRSSIKGVRVEGIDPGVGKGSSICTFPSWIVWFTISAPSHFLGHRTHSNRSARLVAGIGHGERDGMSCFVSGHIIPERDQLSETIQPSEAKREWQMWSAVHIASYLRAPLLMVDAA
jgi:hypothetical protein